MDMENKPLKGSDDLYKYLKGSKLLRNSTLEYLIYLLCLSKPRTPKEISEILYSGKYQLSSINSALDNLERDGFIRRLSKTRIEMRQLGLNTRSVLWESTTVPILRYLNEARSKNLFDEKDLKTIDAILNSNWFKETFFSDDFMLLELNRNTIFVGEFLGRVDVTIDNHRPDISLEDIKRQVKDLHLNEWDSVLMYPSLGSITYILGNFATPKAGINASGELFDKSLNITRSEIIMNGFDKFISERKDKLPKKFREEIEKIKKGIYQRFGEKEWTDFMFKDYASYFIPTDLAYKLSLYFGGTSFFVASIDYSRELSRIIAYGA